MANFEPVLFVLSFLIKSSLSVPTAEAHAQDSELHEDPLRERVKGLESVVNQMDLAIKQLESGKEMTAMSARGTNLELVLRQGVDLRQLDGDRRQPAREQGLGRWTDGERQWGAEKEMFAELRAQWGKAKQQWEIEKQTLLQLLRKFHTASTGSDNISVEDTSKSSVYVVMPRSDDAGHPLESVVTQMAQRLTDLSAEVQSLKVSHAAEIQALNASHTNALQTLQNSISGDMQALRDSNVHQDQAIQEAGSSVYVHWGNTACANSTRVVYSGVVGGSHSGHAGAAANPLCMSMSPVAWSHPSGIGGYSALYGAQYQTYDSVADKDPVCAVCRSPRPTVVMVPGTNRCESGWTVEYSGFLMAGSYLQVGASQYICMDSTFRRRSGGDQKEPSLDLFFSVAHCGSLPCEPYVSGTVITCAVCSK